MGCYKDIESGIKYPVVCICGESGAGKTTFAKTLSNDCVFLDGDAVRKFVTYNLGYSQEDRRTNNKTIADIATLLYFQGLKVVISTVRADIAFNFLREQKIPAVLWEIDINHNKIKKYDCSNSDII